MKKILVILSLGWILVGWAAFAVDIPMNTCAPGPDGAYDGNRVLLDRGSEKDYDFGRGGGCILRPIREVWAVASNQDLMRWNQVDHSQASSLAPPAGVAEYVRVKYTVRRFFITVSWDMDWTYTVVRGTDQDPDEILINYRKVDGTSHIGYWEGSTRLIRLAPDVTAISMGNQIRADQTNADDAGATVTDVIDKLRHGAPDWSALPNN